MKRKIISIFLIFVLAASMLNGCSKIQDERDGVIRLRWVAYGTSVPDDIDKIIKAVNDYSKDKISVVVDLEV